MIGSHILSVDGVDHAGALQERLCAEWYASFGEALYSFVRFQVATADEAEDLVAETFLRAVQAMNRFDPKRASAKTWVFRIAQNLVRDHRRRHRIRRFVGLGFRDLAVDAPSPEERLLREEEVARLLEAVAELAPSEQELISLRYGSNMSATEIAAVLGIRENAVRTRLWRALGRLRERLRP